MRNHFLARNQRMKVKNKSGPTALVVEDMKIHAYSFLFQTLIRTQPRQKIFAKPPFGSKTCWTHLPLTCCNTMTWCKIVPKLDALIRLEWKLSLDTFNLWEDRKNAELTGAFFP